MTIVEKNLGEKQKKILEKAQSKNQLISIKRLNLHNSNTSKIGTFKNIFSDPSMGNPDKQTLGQISK